MDSAKDGFFICLDDTKAYPLMRLAYAIFGMPQSNIYNGIGTLH